MKEDDFLEQAEEKEKTRKHGRSLWGNLKSVNRKIKDTQIVPEDLQVPEEEPKELFVSDPDTGLTKAQVEERVSRGQVNTAQESASKSGREIVFSNLLTYFNLIFFIIALLLIAVGSFKDLTFLPVVIGNTLIGIIQELNAKRILDNLTILNTPKIKVIRDGKESSVQADSLVVDDIIVLTAGNQIPADGEVVRGEALVNEALVTGEADQITKQEGDVLLSGSFIVSGECRARLEKVGADSYVSQLSGQAKSMNDAESSEMIRSLNRLVKIVGILIIPIGLLLFSQQYFINEAGIKSSVTSTMAAIIGMIPEGLYLLANVALAVSSVRLASKKVLVHDMKCIETLARADVLCVDKTGTITDNTMTVKKLLPLKKGEPKEKDSGEDLSETELMLGDFAAAMAVDNITMKAVKDYFRKRSGRRPEKVFPFSSQYKYSAAIFEEASYVLGAPEVVLRDDYDDYAPSVEKYSKEGYRVLVFAAYDGTLDGEALTAKANPLAMILLANPVRANAKEIFSYFEEKGVQIKVISGDNPVTVSEVAKEAGIPNADKYVDATTLVEKDEISAATKRCAVFGRVTPDQKRQLISALKADGHTVAMTGDGVNDVLALKDADCSIAMASGSDAASQVSQLVLLESDFSKLPAVVAEGRRVVNNIERTASLFLVKNIFSLCMSVLSIIFAINYPLEPSQVSLISLFTIGWPAFFLSLEQNTDEISGHFLSNVLFKALPGGLTDFIVISALYLFCVEFGVHGAELSTACTFVLAIVGLMVLFQISRPMTRFHWVLWLCMAGGLFYCMVFMRNIFGISPISRSCLMLLVLFTIVTEPIFRYLRLCMQKLSEAYGSRQRRRKPA